MITSNAALNDISVCTSNCMKWATCDEQTLNCVIISFALTSVCSDEQNIYLHDYFFCVHQTVWGVSPASCDDQNIKLRDYFFALHQTVWGVSPASCDELNIKLHDYLFSRYIKLFDVSPTSCDEQNIKLHDYFFRVTSNCLRCVTRQLWWSKY